VIPILRTIKNVFMNPFEAEAGITFLKTEIPKQIVLVGSPSYNSNGTILLGEAEGGKKILLYTINSINPANRANVKMMIRTIEHEFGHILNQKVKWPPAFNQITVSDYTADWTNQTVDDSYALGFVTPYARSAYGEDWVEMVATMLTEGRAGFEALVANAEALSVSQGLPSAAAKLHQKEAFVVQYYKDVWNIDFYSLQQRVQNALDAISPLPFNPLYTEFGAGKRYSSLNVAKDLQTSANFIALYNKTADTLKAKTGTLLDSLIISKPFTDTLLLTVRFTAAAGTPFYYANFRYAVTNKPDGSMVFSNVIIQSARGVPEANANAIKAGVKPLTDFFTLNTLVLDYKGGHPNSNLVTQTGSLNIAGGEKDFMLGVLK
jgi:substrate import-associated zinc metallohydrolase lipoprotein